MSIRLATLAILTTTACLDVGDNQDDSDQTGRWFDRSGITDLAGNQIGPAFPADGRWFLRYEPTPAPGCLRGEGLMFVAISGDYVTEVTNDGWPTDTLWSAAVTRQHNGVDLVVEASFQGITNTYHVPFTIGAQTAGEFQRLDSHGGVCRQSLIVEAKRT